MSKQSAGERLVRAAMRRQVFTSSLHPLDAEIDAAIASAVKCGTLAERCAIVVALDAALAKHTGVDAYGLRMARGIVKRWGRGRIMTPTIVWIRVKAGEAPQFGVPSAEPGWIGRSGLGLYFVWIQSRPRHESPYYAGGRIDSDGHLERYAPRGEAARPEWAHSSTNTWLCDGGSFAEAKKACAEDVEHRRARGDVPAGVSDERWAPLFERGAKAKRRAGR